MEWPKEKAEQTCLFHSHPHVDCQMSGLLDSQQCRASLPTQGWREVR